MNALQATAGYWTDHGIAVIPIAYRGKRPSLPSWREFQDRLPTADELRRWFQSKFNNLAIVTGWRGLVVLDFDQRPLYDLWYTWSITAAPQARHSYTVQTSRGVHVYFYVDEAVQTMRAGTIDVKAGGGYVLAPPSIHPTGVHYQPLNAAPIMRVDRLAQLLPAALLAQGQAAIPARPRHVIELTDSPWDAAAQPSKLPDRTIADIAAAHNLLELFPGAVRRGRRLWTCCPLHHDTNASLMIDEDGRHARCWAGCLWGDYIDWYAAIHRLTLTEALTHLA